MNNIELAKQIADALGKHRGEFWRSETIAEPDHYHNGSAVLIREDGVKLKLVDAGMLRLKIFSMRVHYKGAAVYISETDRLKTTVRADRSPRDIAKQISRVVIPSATKYFEAATAYVRRQNELAERQKEIAQSLANVLGVEVRKYMGSDSKCVISDKKVRADFSVRDTGLIELKLRGTDVPLFSAIARLVAECNK